MRLFLIISTAMVLSSHRSDGGKKYVVTPRRVQYRLKEQKCSRCFVRTLIIKDFKYGSSLSLLTEKIMTRNGRKVSLFFMLTNNTTAEFDFGISYQGIEG